MSDPLVDALNAFLHQLKNTSTREMSQSRRIFHGRGRCFPGYEQTTIDWFSPVLLVTFYRDDQAVSEQACLQQINLMDWPESVTAIAIQRRYLPRSSVEIIAGDIPEHLVAQRGELAFHIDIGSHQNIGYFLDMEPGRTWVEARAKGKRLLNLFSYTCAFSVVASAAGAATIVNVDMSRSALSRGRDNHRLNQQSLSPITFLGENILKSWGRIRRPGPYDLAIIDPPSYQPGSFIASRDYPKLLKRIPEFMQPGGELLLCLNAPELDETFLRTTAMDVCPALTIDSRLSPHPDFPDINPDQSLKLFSARHLP